MGLPAIERFLCFDCQAFSAAYSDGMVVKYTLCDGLELMLDFY